MAKYTHDGPQRLREAGLRSYGALKLQLQQLGTPTSQHNVETTASTPKSTKKTAAKKSAAKQSASKPTAKKAVKKSAVKKS